MTELTPREILDAIRRGLEESARRFGKNGKDQTPQGQQPNRQAIDVAEREFRSQR